MNKIVVSVETSTLDVFDNKKHITLPLIVPTRSNASYFIKQMAKKKLYRKATNILNLSTQWTDIITNIKN